MSTTTTTYSTEQASKAARIGARIRHHMHTPYWSWRRGDYAPTDPIDRAAVGRLREERNRACRWLTTAADHIGMPLPVGNGTNGPWHRCAVLDAFGRLGIHDSAAGRIAWTDAAAPRYVRRFTCIASRAVSVSEAGGTGGMGSAHRQVALVFGIHGQAVPRISPMPRPTVTWIEWGLSTCYGHCGRAPTSDDYRQEWARLAAVVPVRETTVPQRERLVVSGAYDRVPCGMWKDYTRSRRYPRYEQLHKVRVVLQPDRQNISQYVYLVGLRKDRDSAAEALRSSWMRYVRTRVLEDAGKTLRRCGLMLPESPGGSTIGAVVGTVSRTYGERALADWMAPAPDLSAEETATIREAAGHLLAQDPRSVGLGLRDPWGVPGYPAGANHLTYVLPRQYHHIWEHVLEQPGMSEWLASVRAAAQEEKDRIGLRCDGPVTDEVISVLRDAGYDVVRQQFGHVQCSLHSD